MLTDLPNFDLCTEKRIGNIWCSNTALSKNGRYWVEEAVGSGFFIFSTTTSRWE